jgi:hypothetical protein
MRLRQELNDLFSDKTERLLPKVKDYPFYKKRQSTT